MTALLLLTTLTINVRGGGYVRDDGGYLSHAQTFGWSDIDATGGAILEAGADLTQRLSLYVSWGGFSNRWPTGRLSNLELRTDAVLGHVRYAAWQWRTRDVLGQAQLFLGAGWYRLSESLDDRGRTDSSLGVRGSADFVIHWRWIGFLLGYGYHAATASVSDRLGGTLGAGGHEVSAGLSLRWY